MKFKECNCDEDCWEEIVVKNDDDFPNRTVIYYHCMNCSTDFRIEDFETGEELFYPTILKDIEAKIINDN